MNLQSLSSEKKFIHLKFVNHGRNARVRLENVFFEHELTIIDSQVFDQEIKILLIALRSQMLYISSFGTARRESFIFHSSQTKNKIIRCLQNLNCLKFQSHIVLLHLNQQWPMPWGITELHSNFPAKFTQNKIFIEKFDIKLN